jgi:DNA-binding transcriptional ArsR family regulator
LRKQRSRRSAPQLHNPALLFAALGDETRLQLLFRLCHQGPTSITRLSRGFKVTRQAVSKHLRVMQRSGLVCSTRHGRENIWQLDQPRLHEVRHYLELISKQWNDALGRLRGFVEN